MITISELNIDNKNFSDIIADFETSIEKKTDTLGIDEYFINASYVISSIADDYDNGVQSEDDGCREIENIPFEIYCKMLDSVHQLDTYGLFELTESTDDVMEMIEGNFSKYEIFKDLHGANDYWQRAKENHKKFVAEISMRVDAQTKVQAELKAKKIAKVIDANYDNNTTLMSVA